MPEAAAPTSKTKRRLWIFLGAGVALAAVAAVIGLKFFAPQPSTRVDHPMPAGAAAEGLRGGEFTGGDAVHQASGRVALHRDAQGHFLRFENYEATDGPNVHFYLSEDPGGTWAEATTVEIPVPEGVDGSQATLRGTFNVRVPQGVDPAKYQSVIAWCTRFSAKFGSAPLR